MKKHSPIVLVVIFILIFATLLSGCKKSISESDGDAENIDNNDSLLGDNDGDDQPSDESEPTDRIDDVYDSDDGYEYEDDFDYEENQSGDDYPSFDDTEYTPVSNDVLNVSFDLSESEISSFLKTIADIKVSYPKSEYYDIDKSINLYNSLKFDYPSGATTVIKNKKVDYNVLLNIVKENNKTPVKGKYYTLASDILENSVRIITDTVNYNLEKNPYINLSVLDYRLKNLRIHEYDDYAYAFYSHVDNLIAINMTVIKQSGSIDKFEEIISHEANHMIQDPVISWDDSIETGICCCYAFNKNNVDSLYWPWYTEGIAQYGTLLQYGIDLKDSFTYMSDVKWIMNIISTYAMDHDNIHEFYHIASQPELEKMFDLFECRSENDKKELISMMIAINLYADETDPFLSEPVFESAKIDDLYTFTKQLNNAIGQTLAKNFYRNLAEKISKSNVKIKDIFEIIAAFETVLSSAVWYDSEERVAYMGDCINNYCVIQDAFFDIMAKKVNIGSADLKNYYINYFHTTSAENFDCGFLNESQNDFYKDLYMGIDPYGRITVAEAKIKYKK